MTEQAVELLQHKPIRVAYGVVATFIARSPSILISTIAIYTVYVIGQQAHVVAVTPSEVGYNVSTNLLTVKGEKQ